MTDPDRSRTLRRMAEETADKLWELGEWGCIAGPRSFDDTLESLAHAVASAVRQELEPYLQHKAECRELLCQVCRSSEDDDSHYIGTPDSHAFTPNDCTCGFALLRDNGPTFKP